MEILIAWDRREFGFSCVYLIAPWLLKSLPICLVIIFMRKSDLPSIQGPGTSISHSTLAGSHKGSYVISTKVVPVICHFYLNCSVSSMCSPACLNRKDEWERVPRLWFLCVYRKDIQIELDSSHICGFHVEYKQPFIVLLWQENRSLWGGKPGRSLVVWADC